LALAAAGSWHAGAEWVVALLLVASVTFLVACASALFGNRPFAVRWMIGPAVAFRLLFATVPPSLSDDVWRYLWDGEVAAAGINPYRFAPDDLALSGLRDATWERMNHRSISTIYPPYAQLLFRAVAPRGGLMGWKVVVLAFDLLALLGVMEGLRAVGRPAALAILYAWNPLVLTEFAWNAHVDVVAVAGVTWAVVASLRERPRLAVALVCLAGGIKLFPLALLPVFVKRSGCRPGIAIAAAIGLAGAVPYASAGLAALSSGLRVYAETWEFNGSLYEALRSLVAPSTARLLLAVAMLTVVACVTRSSADVPDATLWILACMVFVSPTVHPWYATWLIPPLARRAPRASLLLFTQVVVLSYVVLAVRDATGRWFLPARYANLEWWPVWSLLGVELLRSRRERAVS